MNSLRIIDACTEEHFAAMSRIHARGWHAAYPGHVPDDYLRDVITEDHWIPFFREDYATGRCRGLLLYDGENPVCCCTCGPVRLGPSPRQSEGLVIHGEAYRGWGEIISFYTDPACTGRGYGSVLMEEALRRLGPTATSTATSLSCGRTRGPAASTPGTALPGTGRRSTFPSPTT